MFKKAFGRLSRACYVRHFLFSLIFLLPVLTLGASSPYRAASMATAVIAILNSLLYPYARFAYERAVGFILGDNVFIVGAVPLLAVKFMTMGLCWAGAIFVGPAVLVYFYVHNNRSSA